MESVKGKVVLITGSSSGIGAAAAVLFAKYGSKLVLTGRNKENLNKTAEKCISQGLDKQQVLTVTGDICKDEDLKHLVDTAVSTFGTIHILVNNAATSFSKSVLDTSLEYFEDGFKALLRAPVALIQLVVPYLKENKGSIVNISTVVATRPIPACAVYSVMKAGLLMVTKNLALELAPFGVRVNEIRPAAIRTPAFKELTGIKDETKLNEFFKETGKTYPIGRVGLPEEVAQAIVFLASDASSFTTGETLNLDGGWLLKANLGVVEDSLQ